MITDPAAIKAAMTPKPTSRPLLAEAVRFAEARRDRAKERLERATTEHTAAEVQCDRAAADLAQWDFDNPPPAPAETIAIEAEPDPQLNMF